ncbi:MAG: helix-turn-helix domain-containing protein [Austwickia sp.]|nr:helix-turn-helix domain-containing protein [Austwickia sp.]
MEPVIIVAYDGVQPIDVAGPHEAFSFANDALAERGRPPAYELAVVAATPEVTSGSGLRLGATTLAEHGPVRGGTLVIPGGRGARRPVAAPLRAWLADARPDRLLLACTGSFLAAAVGLIGTPTPGVADGPAPTPAARSPFGRRRVTTHWRYADNLAATHPGLDVDPDPVWLQDGPVWSSGGVTAGIDLALAVVAADLGGAIAQEVARTLVMYVHRPGNQSQFAAPVWRERATDDRIRGIERALAADPGGDHSVDSLAARAGMSPRHFQRLFAQQTGRPVGTYLAELRITTAQRLLAQTDHPTATVARLAGFGSHESMRRTFGSQLGVSPTAYRSAFARPDSALA